MELGIKVGDIMTRDPVHVTPNSSIIDCAKKMVKNRIGSLLVKEKEKLKGILTERDIIWALTKKTPQQLKEIKVSNLAHKKISTIKPSMDVYNALSRMKKTKYRWLPVVERGKVIGLLTLKDILRIQPNLFDMCKDMIAIKKSRMLKESEREGICEKCGSYEVLYDENRKFVCEDCRS